jgi:hypothetical protein
MFGAYGRGTFIPSEVSERFIRAGRFKEVVRDGIWRRVPTPEALEEIKRLGLERSCSNLVQEPARQLIAGLIRTFAAGTGGLACEVLYWACGPGGQETEPLGRVTLAELEGLTLSGPRRYAFGSGTCLAPAFRHFLDLDGDANGVFVFLTVGRIDDEEDVIDLTHRAAREIADGSRATLRCVLIGVGPHIEEDQLARIDALDMPASLLRYDLWNALRFEDMRGIADAWSQIADPHTEVATYGTAYDHLGRPVHTWTDGLAARVAFRLPSDAPYFELELDGHRFRQELPRE